MLLIENFCFHLARLWTELPERLQMGFVVGSTLAARPSFEQLREAIGQLRAPFREYVIAITASNGVRHRAERDVKSLLGDVERPRYPAQDTGCKRVKFNFWSVSR